MEKNEKLEAKIHALEQVHMLRVQQAQNRNLLKKLYARKWKFLALLYVVVNLLWRLAVSKKILKT